MYADIATTKNVKKYSNRKKALTSQNARHEQPKQSILFAEANDMKVSMRIYGEQAQTLAKELGLECRNKTADVQMTAHFTYKDVEGRTVVTAEFTSKEAVVVKSTEQKQKETLEQEAECAQLRAELAGFMTEVV